MHIKHIVFAAFCGIGITFATPALAQVPQVPPGTFFFDFFLADNASSPANNFDGFLQWDVIDGTGTVDLINLPGVTNVPLPTIDRPEDGGRFVDLDGSTNDAGVFSTRASFTFLAGTTYNLRFRYNSPSQTVNAATATIGTQVFNFSSSSLAFQQFDQNFTFAQTTVASLVFQDTGNDSNGTGIDAVTLAVVGATAPEPGTASLLGIAALSGILMLRHRK